MQEYKIKSKDALLVIDVQNDFCSFGSLPVKDGENIVPTVNFLSKKFNYVIFTQDWHPSNHVSFASQHFNRKEFDEIVLPYGEQILWPDHCIRGTTGAEFHKDLNIENASMIIRKGFRKNIDSYSAFFENDKKTPTGLFGFLNEHEINRLFFSGLATDICVKDSIFDAKKLGFECYLIIDCCKGLDEKKITKDLKTMKSHNINILNSSEIDTKSNR